MCYLTHTLNDPIDLTIKLCSSPCLTGFNPPTGSENVADVLILAVSTALERKPAVRELCSRY